MIKTSYRGPDPKTTWQRLVNWRAGTPGSLQYDEQYRINQEAIPPYLATSCLSAVRQGD